MRGKPVLPQQQFFFEEVPEAVNTLKEAAALAT